jgi:hypothetical protein
VLARVGFAARGLIYLLIGGFASVAAFRSDQHPHGFTDAAQAVLNKPFGNFVVLGIAVGIACLAGWLAVESFADYSGGHGRRRWLRAIGRLGDAIFYGALVFLLLTLLLGWHVGGEHELHSWVAWLFASPGGRWLAGLIGGGLTGGGIGLVVWAWSGDIAAPLDLNREEKEVAGPVSRYGVTGRGLALALIGLYLIGAAIHGKPQEAHELGGLLLHLRQTPYGWVALLLFALAFGASAFFDFAAALYRRIDPPSR